MTRLAVFIRDASSRSSWGCVVSLVQFAIEPSNAALLRKFQ
jgi:hypothetical protein